MHTRRGAALEAVRRRVARATRTPAFGLAVITPIVLAGAVSASSPQQSAPVSNAAVTPLAAVAPEPTDPLAGPIVIAFSQPPAAFHVAAPNLSAPPPLVVISSPGAMRIPAIALSAYRNAERMMAAAYPGCGVSWSLLAGIGRIESLHADGGATDAKGTALQPIYGPPLDGTLPGNEIVVESVHAGRVQYARAMGPMQFLPGTWARYASDGKGDGKADPQNLFDAALAAARYLCAGGLNLRDPSQVMSAILRYNDSVAYARNVIGWATAYATGVVPVDLPPITGPIPALGDAHLDAPEGLGPGMPLTAMDLPPDDPLAQPRAADPGTTDMSAQLPPAGVPPAVTGPDTAVGPPPPDAAPQQGPPAAPPPPPPPDPPPGPPPAAAPAPPPAPAA